MDLTVTFSENLNEMLGELFLPCETPEAPKPSLFQKLVGGGPGTLDREELCKSLLDTVQIWAICYCTCCYYVLVSNPFLIKHMI